MTDIDPIEGHILSLEKRLLEPEVRRSATEVGLLLDDGFREFASNGLSYDKAAIIAALRAETPTHSTLSEFHAELLSPDVVLATFRYHRHAAPGRPEAESIRSSIWRRTDGRWRMVFHQGTLCPS